MHYPCPDGCVAHLMPAPSVMIILRYRPPPPRSTPFLRPCLRLCAYVVDDEPRIIIHGAPRRGSHCHCSGREVERSNQPLLVSICNSYRAVDLGQADPRCLPALLLCRPNIEISLRTTSVDGCKPQNALQLSYLVAREPFTSQTVVQSLLHTLHRSC